MELFELSAKLKLDDSSFNKGIDNAVGAGERLKGQISAATIAVGNLAADMVRKGVSAISGVINGAIDGYANYQQLIGGVETLFGASANKVANYAKKSFKTTGLSANDYMETVTSFSASLLQGLGGDTSAAADLANVAITDMADNANKMGTDISMIQNAYQGFAKQNYTMLDNLKLGYGGTKGEMVRLINDSGILEEEIKDLDGITFPQLIQAIHVIQQEMGITGTTAAEAAGTISGSKGSLSAAWQDLLTAVGGEGDQKRLDETIENFKGSFTGYMENFIPSIVETIGNSGSLVNAIADSIASLPSDLLSQVAESGLEAGSDMVGGVGKITDWIIDNITNVFRKANIDSSSVIEFGETLGNFLGQTLQKVILNAPTITLGVLNAGINLAGSLISGLTTGLLNKKSEVDEVTSSITAGISEAEQNATKASAVLKYLQDIRTKYGSAARKSKEWKEAEEQLREALGDEKVEEIFKQYGDNVDIAIQKLQDFVDQTRKTAIMQALVNGQKDLDALLAGQVMKRQAEERTVRDEGYVADAAREKIETSLKGYAQGMLDTLAEEFGGVENVPEEARNHWKALAERGVLESEVMGQIISQSISDMDLGDLLLLAQETGKTLTGRYGNEGGEIWNQSASDYILDPDTLKDQADLIATSQANIAVAEENIKALEAEIQETQKQIDLNKELMASTVEETIARITTGSDAAGTSIANGGSVLQSKLEAIAENLPLFGGNYALKATGIDYVPSNGFRTELHRGEGVLTAAENQAYRNGMGTAEVVGAIQELRQDMQNLRLVVGKKTFGRAVVNYGGGRMNDYIGQAENWSASGYGA